MKRVHHLQACQGLVHVQEVLAVVPAFDLVQLEEGLTHQRGGLPRGRVAQPPAFTAGDLPEFTVERLHQLAGGFTTGGAYFSSCRPGTRSDGRAGGAFTALRRGRGPGRGGGVAAAAQQG